MPEADVNRACEDHSQVLMKHEGLLVVSRRGTLVDTHHCSFAPLRRGCERIASLSPPLVSCFAAIVTRNLFSRTDSMSADHAEWFPVKLARLSEEESQSVWCILPRDVTMGHTAIVSAPSLFLPFAILPREKSRLSYF